MHSFILKSTIKLNTNIWGRIRLGSNQLRPDTYWGRIHYKALKETEAGCETIIDFRFVYSLRHTYVLQEVNV